MFRVHGRSGVRWGALIIAIAAPVSAVCAQLGSPPSAGGQPQPPPPVAPVPVYAGAPPLVLVTPPLDLGYRKPKSMAQGQITLLNNAEHRIKITRIKPDCACTAAIPDKTELAPGETAHLDVGVEVPREIGPIRRDIRIECEGYAVPFVVGVDLEAGFAVRVNGGGPAAVITDRVGLVKLDSVDKRPFRVLAINGAPPDFLGDTAAQTEPRTQFTIRYDWSHTSGDSIPRWMIIVTDHPEARMFSVRARIQGHVNLQNKTKWFVLEERVLVGSIPGETTAKTHVTLSGKPLTGGQKIAITSSDGKIPVRIINMRKPDQGGGMLAEIEVAPIAGYRGFFSTVVAFALDGDVAAFDVYGHVGEPTDPRIPASE